MDDRKKSELKSGTIILTIGHSTQSLDRFLDLLRMADVSAVADVRSSPFSKRYPHFSKPVLHQSLKDNGFEYAFLGKELGGRPNSSSLYCGSIADYEKMALEPSYIKGIERIVNGSKKHKIAMMCSEHNPLDCHRCLLVSRSLNEKGYSISHILSNGNIESHHDIEMTLLKMFGSTEDDMFTSREDKLAKAYRSRAMSVAYRKPEVSVSEREFNGHNNAI